MPYRLIPSDLWFREHRKYPWVAQFLCEVSLDEYRKKPISVAAYASRFGSNRTVIRRLLYARRAEFDRDREATPTRQERDTSSKQNQSLRSEERQPCDTDATGARHILEDREQTTDQKKTKRPRKAAIAFPSEPSEVEALRASLLAWAADPTKKHPGYAAEQVDFAIEAVREWAGDHQRRPSWLATVQGGMRRGWALEGFGVGPGSGGLSKAQQRDMRTLSAGKQAIDEMLQRRPGNERRLNGGRT